MSISLNLNQVSKSDISLVGGKAAQLGELVQVGLAVPSGSVLTTQAYDLFVQENKLQEIIQKKLKQGGNYKQIRTSFINGSIPEIVKEELLKLYQQFDKVPVVVRSSATAEDLPSAAFAGQQETYLNIINEEQLFAAVKKTWASAWTDRVIAYRNNRGFDHKQVKPAIIIQTMINAEFAGVLFTANPTNGHKNQIVINTNPGLGEAVVSGSVTPDHYVFEKRWFTWKLKEEKKGKREVIIKPKEGGGTKAVKANQSPQKIAPKTLSQLMKLGKQIEQVFGSPQDIEWAVRAGDIFILQSRPITTLAQDTSKASLLARMMAANIAEVMPERPYPLEATTFGPELLLHGLLRPVFKIIGLITPRTKEVFPEKDGVIISYNGQVNLRLRWQIVLTPFKLVWASISINPKKWKQDTRLQTTIETLQQLEKKDVKKLTNEELIATLNQTLKTYQDIFAVRIKFIPSIMVAVAKTRLLLWLFGKQDALEKLLYSGIETKVTETNAALEKLAKKIRADKELVQLFRKNETAQLFKTLQKKKWAWFFDDFSSFLAKYGYRETEGTARVSKPTWKESPQTVLGLLKGMIVADHTPKSVKSWIEIKNAVVAKTPLASWPLKGFFERTLANARCLHELREDTRFYIMMSIPTIRAIIFEAGQRLVRAKALTTKQDVLYLKRAELVRFLSGKMTSKQIAELVKKRKKQYTALKDVPFVDPQLYLRSNENEEALLVGIAGSPGIVEAKANIIKNSSEFDKLKSGEILVTAFTNPAWTPLFERASGVVVNTGGPISHAAIVAREYGIPAVMATADATKKIKNGDMIRVDGDQGKVYLVK